MVLEVEQLQSQAKSLAAEFNQGGGTKCIDDAILLGRAALESCPPGHHMRFSSLARLASHLSIRYYQLGTMTDLEEAIVFAREALQLHPQGHPLHLSILGNLARYLSARYNQLGAMEDLEEAIVLCREALRIHTQEHPDRSKFLDNLAVCLSTRYHQLGSLQDLEEAIILYREALQLRPQGHPLRSSSLGNLGMHLTTRYKQFGAVQDLEEAIVLGRETLRLHPEGHHNRSKSLDNLAVRLSTRYHQLGAIEDLEEAIVLGREALKLRPQRHPLRSSSLSNLAVRLSTRYSQLGVMQDLEEAIIFGREALELCPQGHPGHSTSLGTLAICLSTRFRQLGNMEDLEEAIALGREELQLHPQGHPLRSSSLNDLGVRLSTRHNQFGAIEDLEEAIVLGREVLQLCPLGHPSHSHSLCNLAMYISTRHKQLGAMQDLEEAIVLAREALRLCPEGHPHRSGILGNLANDLSISYNQLGAVEDLEEAISLGREALQLRPRGHPGRSSSLVNLAVYLSNRYNRLHDMENLNEAIDLSWESLQLCPQGHPDRPVSVGNLALHLSTRYAQLRTVRDLDDAIVFGREALQLSPQGHPDRWRSLNNLAVSLSARHHQLDTSEDLDTSKSGSSHSSDDCEELFSVYAQLAELSHVVSSGDLTVSRAWIRTAELFKHSSTLLAYETSLRLLVHHLSMLPSLPQHLVILKTHTSTLAMDAFSACLRNHVPERAVELLEQGRSVFWNQLTRLRSPLDAVIASGPVGKTLADEFTHFSSLIRKALDSPGGDQHEQVCRLNVEMQRVVTAIRKLPGLSRFLLPSRFTDLQCAAIGGPVIIVNASQYSCDALIIIANRAPVHIPLSITKEYAQRLCSMLPTLTGRAKLKQVTNALGRVLRDLWEDVVFPVVRFLQTTYPTQSRIWWCPTAEFCDLPLHAAGPYRKGQQNLADLYISSYTPTLSALIHSRRSRSPQSLDAMKRRFVAIGQAAAPGQAELFSVSSELTNIGQRVNDHATFTQIEGHESSISRVAEELAKNQWVHFACHGLANRQEPFESAFALCDGIFPIERIIGCDLEDPEFAYLSACQTTVGDEESPDEMIHLASAMQFIGFRSVIGTMWAVDDGHTNKITSTFYGHMVDASGRLDYTRAAWALNKTMRSISAPLDQLVLYIHIGA